MISSTEYVQKLFPKFLLAVLLLTGSASFQQAGAQTTQDNPFRLEFTSYISGSTDSDGTLPFWLYANRDGIVDSSSTNWINELRFEQLLTENEDISLYAAGNIAGRLSGESTLFVPELYLRAEAYGLRLQAGRFPQTMGLGNHELSSGSIMMSRNATPIPGISISTPDFLVVPYTDGDVQVKGSFSHGWMGDDRFVEGSFLHHKSAYLRLYIGNFSATGGLIHNVVWGGRHPELGRLPQSFGDFLRAVAGKSAEERDGTPVNETKGVIGNSVAAYDFGLQYEHEQFTLLFSRMYFLEASISPKPIVETPWDGSWGLHLNLESEGHFLNAISYEYINTTQANRSGQVLREDNYYNNGIYLSGWTYKDRVLGNPLFLFDAANNLVFNNVFLAHHLGVKGTVSRQLSYTAFATFSRNYGNVFTPGEHFDQLSGYLRVAYSLPQRDSLSLFASIAADIGELYSEKAGFQLGFSWRY